MPVRTPKWKVNDKVEYQGHPATVIAGVSRGKVTIRNRFGYPESVPASKLTKRS